MIKLLYILQKEFKQIFRDKLILIIIFFVPILQLVVLPWAVDLDVRHIKFSIVDLDNSSISQLLTYKIPASGNFELYNSSKSYKEAINLMENEQIDVIITIPHNFEKNLIKENHEKVSIVIDAINSVKAGIIKMYISSIINDFNSEINIQYNIEVIVNNQPPIITTSSAWYNSNYNYKHFMVPAILVLLVTVVGAFLTTMNIVREKEIGTIEQLNVTPIKKWQFILGKLIPFLIISLVVFTIGLLITIFLYKIHVAGSFFTLYLLIFIYLIGLLGFGLLISTVSATQQQSMFISFFFIMIFILMSGLFTIVDSMPYWAKIISNLIPMTHFMNVVRAIFLKGSSLCDLKNEAYILMSFAVVLNSLAIYTYKKKS